MGCCDCGDEDAINAAGFCAMHARKQSQKMILERVSEEAKLEYEGFLEKIFFNILGYLDSRLPLSDGARKYDLAIE
jgi:hypothetical protein